MERRTPRTTESQEDTMTSTKTAQGPELDAPKPPKRTRSTSAAAAAGQKAVAERIAAKAAKTTPASVIENDPAEGMSDAAVGAAVDTERQAVAARATQVKTEQDAAPKPSKGITAQEQANRDAAATAKAERIAKVIEMRKGGAKLSEIAKALDYTSQQVVSGVLRRHAPELQTQREAGTGGLTLTAEQVTELQAVETKFGAKLTTLARALARATA